jgi:sigma-B regulation protein RsbU (phosphoserine phosphatase)
MPHPLLIVTIALLLGTGALVHVVRLQRRRIRELRQQKDKLAVEERRVFDFLHGIGEALTDEHKPSDLHQMLVEGAVRILEAQGGALYVTAPGGGQLRPAYLSRNCPPLVELPPGFGGGVADIALALRTFQMLRAVRSGEGLLGAVWQDRLSLFLRGHDPRLAVFQQVGFKTHSVMASALVYGGQTLGVLVLAKMDDANAPFTGEHFMTFKAIADQSAFALFDLIVFSEAAEKRRLDQDLQVAGEVQRILLPTGAPQLSGFEIAGVNLPARLLSGDYFDYMPVGERELGIVIADVSGKGVPASLIMSMARAVLRVFARANPSPADALRRLNGELYEDIKEDMFISMAYVVLRADTGELLLARAGHDAPLIYRAQSGTVEKVVASGIAVGIDSGAVFNRVLRDTALQLSPGDALLLYTDGVTEALDKAGDEFGLDAMVASIRQAAGEGASAIVKRVTEDVRAFVGDHPQYDDITFIAIQRVASNLDTTAEK